MKPFHETVPAELNQVQARRNAVLGETTPAQTGSEGTPEQKIAAVRDRAKRMDLLGVSFSGGGIRSATFCLGMLQALGKLGLLKRVDYLSTVSGGGYIGGWLAAWIRRETDGLPAVLANADPVRNVERQLDPDRTSQARSVRRKDDDSDADPFRPHFAEDAEPSPIHHLRAHSRYLAPATGLLSLDRWVLCAIYIRNLAVNALIAVPLLAFVVFAVRFAVYGFAQWERIAWVQWAGLGGFFLVVGAIRAHFDNWLTRVRLAAGLPPHDQPWSRSGIFILLAVAGYAGMVLLAPIPTGGAVDDRSPSRMPGEFRPGEPGTLAEDLFDWLGPWTASHYVKSAILFVALASGTLLYSYRLQLLKFSWSRRRVLFPILAIASVIAMGADYETEGLETAAAKIFIGLSIGSVAISTFLALIGVFLRPGRALDLKMANVRIVTTYAYAIVLGLLVAVIIHEFLYFGTSRPAAFAAFATPLFLLAIWVAGFVEVALAGGWFNDYEREGRSRFGAWILLVAVGWLAIFLTVIYLPPFLDNTAGTVSVAVVGALTAAVRTLVPRLSKMPGFTTWFAVRIVPILFLVALLTLVAAGVDRVLTHIDKPIASEAVVGTAAGSAREWDYATRLEKNGWPSLLAGLGGALLLFAVFVVVVPANRFSLHALYANRLIRAYLGASRRAPNYEGVFAIPTAVSEIRSADDFSHFDSLDDLPLLSLRADAGYLGPYPIFNTTLNLVSGSDLAYQDRRGESFTLTPDFCGSESTEYVRLHRRKPPSPRERSQPNGEVWNLTVGRAITISGAAVDANMTNYYSPQFTALLTLLNARLGWWLENPYRKKSGRNSGLRRIWNLLLTGDWSRRPFWNARPPVGSSPYIRELLGDTDAHQKFVHLSDGGHYENTGAYELIRRRCRFVLLVDAAANADNTSENLANLVRVVHSDFGIRIIIDTAPLKRGPDGFSKWHCAVGAIRYDDVDAGGVIGTLLFIRSSLTGDEPADIKNYASVVPVFPHHPTYDQFFDEAQFESYRGLGYHIGMTVLAEAADSTKAHVGDYFHRRLFAKLRRTWTPSTAAQSTQYVESCRDFLKQNDGSDNRQHHRDLLAHFAEAVRTPAGSPTARFDPTDDGEFREQLQRAQLMEMAWLMNDLDRSYSHPIQRGWVNTLRGWTADREFQEAWPRMRTCFSQGFVRFCERALNVNPPTVKLAPFPPAATDFTETWITIIEEFQQEHGDYLRDGHTNAGEYLPAIREEAAATGEFYLIGYGSPHTGDALGPVLDDIRQVVGFIAIVPSILDDHDNRKELILWIRGNYRMAGIGGVALRLLKNAGLLRNRRLFARLPRRGSGTAELLQRALWVQFLNDFDFYGLATTGPVPDEWERRELRVGAGM